MKKKIRRILIAFDKGGKPHKFDLEMINSSWEENRAAVQWIRKLHYARLDASEKKVSISPPR